MKKVLAMMMMLAVLVGCTGDKQTTLIGKGSANGTTCEVELVSNGDIKGDILGKSKEVITMDWKANELANGLTKEEAKELVESIANMLNEVEGIKAEGKLDDTEIVLTTEIDYEKVDMKDLKKVGLLVNGNDAADYISLKMTKERYEKKYNVIFEEK